MSMRFGTRTVVVADGFVGLAAAHYDWATRSASLHTLFAEVDNLETVWHSFPNLHSIVVKVGPVFRAIDLGTGGRHPEPLPGNGLSDRAKTAPDTARNLVLSAPHLPVFKADHRGRPICTHVDHDAGTGIVQVIRPLGDTEYDAQLVNKFVPMSDGRPRLIGPTTLTAHGRIDFALTVHATFPSWSLHDLKRRTDSPNCRVRTAHTWRSYHPTVDSSRDKRITAS
jgi:hypothetical protein